MATGSWLDTKEQVRQAVDIVDLVGSYIQLRRAGRGYAGLCPWHDDSKPSLTVNPERQSYKCFVCDIGGDVFSFMMQMEKVDFRQALQMLADRAGLKLQTAGGRNSSDNVDEKRLLLQTAAWAEHEFHKCLLSSSDADPGRKYLAERGISDASVEQFQLGFAPNEWDWLVKRAASASIPAKVLEKIGLVGQRQSGSGYYDLFRGRVIFPIRDAATREARPIAFGGRILPEWADDRTGKYFNSPETPLFSKNRQVYGLDQARDEVQKQKNVVVVEGYTDCIIAHQFGVKNVVAVLGTALGDRHISLLRRFADRITLVLDGDEAGQKRTNEILELFIAAQVDLRILTLPQNLDPCDFVLSHGSEAFSQLLDKAVDALEHKIASVTKGLDITADLHQSNEVLEDVLATIARAPRLSSNTESSALLREEQVLSRLARKFQVPEERLRTRMADLRRRAARPKVARPESESTAASLPRVSIGQLDLWDREFLELAINHADMLPQLMEAIRAEHLSSPTARLIYSKSLELFASGITPDFNRLMLEAEDPGIKNLLVNLEESDRAKATSDASQRLRDVLQSFQRRHEDAQHRNSLAAIQEGSSEASQEEELNRLMASLKTRHGRSEPTEG